MPMRKRFFCLVCLLTIAMMLQAQDIQRHECWIDSDYSHRQTLDSGDSISVSFSIEGLASGLHFFNHRALNTNNEWGVLNRTLFFILETKKGNTAITAYEYWIDEDDPIHQETDSIGSEFLLVIDLSGLDDGEHTFSFRAQNGNGEWGSLSVQGFTIDKSQWENGVKALLMIEGHPFDVYSTNGVLIRQRTTSLEGLKPGIYIIGGHKVAIH